MASKEIETLANELSELKLLVSQSKEKELIEEVSKLREYIHVAKLSESTKTPPQTNAPKFSLPSLVPFI